MKRVLSCIVLACLLLASGRWLRYEPVARAGIESTNGDTNGDGARDISDAVYLLSWLFDGGPEPVACAGSTDLESRVFELERGVSEILAATRAPDRSIEKALEDLGTMSFTGSEVWNQPLHAFRADISVQAESRKLEAAVDGADAGRVLGFHATEAVSSASRLQAVVEMSSPSLDPASAIGRELLVTYTRGGRGARWRGAISRASLTAVSEGSAVYHIEAETFMPVKALHSRIFQGRTHGQIAASILTGAGASVEDLLQRTYEPREYVVQYNETDFDFVGRLLAEEGISFAVQSTEETTKVIFFDGVEGMIPPAGPPLLHAGEESTGAAGEHITHLRRAAALPADRVTVGENDYVRAAGPVFVSAEVPGGSLESFHFGVGRVDGASLSRIAQDRLEGLQMERNRLTGAGNSADVRAGALIDIVSTRHSAFNGKYYVTGATHTFVVAGSPGAETIRYANSFQCIPSASPVRPRVSAPAPLVGVLTGIITGPPGSSRHTDSLGRVKVKFHWDRETRADENASVWIRVAHHGSGAGGAFYLPEVGDEVLVAFEHGDPNRPVVLGSLWNGADRPPPVAGQ